MGNPAYCPHGNPIPSSAGDVKERNPVSLSTLNVGETCTVQAIAPESSDVLNYLSLRDLLPGQTVTVLEIAPLQGPLTLRVGSSETALGQNLAELVLVKKHEGV